MKKILFLTAVLCGMLGFQSCNLDNYDEPTVALVGALVDSETNETVPSQYQNGAKIRLYEFYNGDWTKQPNDFYTKQDGTFTNKAVFPGKYKVIAEGPFEKLQPVEIEIGGTTELQLKVVPFLRVSASATATGTAINMTAKVSHTVSKCKIKAIEFYCGKTPYVDKNTFHKKATASLADKTDSEIVSTTFTTTISELVSGTTYYMRVGALGENPGNQYNYSQVIEVKVP